MSKSKMLTARLDPLSVAKLETLAKDHGVSRSEMLRIILEDIPKGTVDNKGKVTLVQGDGECVPITSDEIFERE